MEIIALVYAPDHPRDSMAMVGVKEAQLVRLGSWIGERQVIGMGPMSLVLGPVEEPCLMRLTERSERRPPPRKRRRRRR